MSRSGPNTAPLPTSLASKEQRSGSRSRQPFISGSIEVMNISNLATAPVRELNFASKTFDLATKPLRELNHALHLITDSSAEQKWDILNPKGSHAVAAGVDQPVEIDVHGSVGYYCGGMNQQSTITV